MLPVPGAKVGRHCQAISIKPLLLLFIREDDMLGRSLRDTF